METEVPPARRTECSLGILVQGMTGKQSLQAVWYEILCTKSQPKYIRIVSLSHAQSFLFGRHVARTET